ncbi:MAG TPA: hypothetical protein VK891_15920, partial [Euzebyales bacterium]|nr:hypothetical protein [Euzebyales bacterium]
VSSYRMTDNRASQLAIELQVGKSLSDAQSAGLPSPAPEVTAQVWIDDASGLVQRVFAEQMSSDVIDRHTWLERHDITLTPAGGTAIDAPARATDVTLDEWCTRDRNAAWCD